MAARKPLMTPEQQKNFKEAVEKKLINPLPYDQYCKLTPEEAEKMLKEVNMGTQAPEKSAPAERPGANEPATKFQIKAIDDAVKAGIIEDPGEEVRKNLTKGSASEIISEIHAKRPPEQATESQKKEIDRLVKEGRIYPMKNETYHTLSKDKASELISIGHYNEGQKIVVEGFDPNYVARRNQPKTPEQEAELKRLVAEKRLNPVPREKWANLTQEEAGKLIFVGQRREEENSFAPPRDHEQTKEQEKTPEKPEKKTPAKNKTSRSRGDDMPM